MIYFLYGSDTHKSRKKLHELLNLASKKRPEAQIFKINSENWNESQFDELISAQGLFEQKYTVVLDNLFEKKDIKEYVLDNISKLALSNQIFLILEEKTDIQTIKKIKKEAKQIQQFDKKENKKEEISIFSITNKLIHRDKKGLWVSYLDLISQGVKPEEIHGLFFWQIKNMILSYRSKNQIETGLSPFVYKNAQIGLKNFLKEELNKISSQLVEMTHKVRQGKGDLDIMLEKWILQI